MCSSDLKSIKRQQDEIISATRGAAMNKLDGKTLDKQVAEEYNVLDIWEEE